MQNNNSWFLMISKCVSCNNNMIESYSKAAVKSWFSLACLACLTTFSSLAKYQSEVTSSPISPLWKLISKDQSSSKIPQCQTGGQICCPVSQLQLLMDSVLINSSLFSFSSLNCPPESLKLSAMSLALCLAAFCLLLPLRLDLPLFLIHASTPCSSCLCQCALGGLLGVVV